MIYGSILGCLWEYLCGCCGRIRLWGCGPGGGNMIREGLRTAESSVWPRLHTRPSQPCRVTAYLAWAAAHRRPDGVSSGPPVGRRLVSAGLFRSRPTSLWRSQQTRDIDPMLGHVGPPSTTLCQHAPALGQCLVFAGDGSDAACWKPKSSTADVSYAARG